MRKSQKTGKSVWAIFGKSTGHIGLKFCTESFLTRMYNFVFIKIFVGGRLGNNIAKFVKQQQQQQRHEAVLDLLGYA